MLSNLNSTVKVQAEKIHHIEDKMGDLYVTHNDAVDMYTDHEAEIQHLQIKLADIEGQSRWNNIKFLGIPESVSASVKPEGPYSIWVS